MSIKHKSSFQAVWLPLLAILVPAGTAILIALLSLQKSEPEPGPAPEPKPTLQAAVNHAAADAQRAIREAEGELSCFQQVIGPNINLTFSATKDYYPLGRYAIEEAPKSKRLAAHLLNIHGRFAAYTGSELKISLNIAGTADATPLFGKLPYDGIETECSTELGPRYLRRGTDVLDNELLGCARAADFLRHLRENKSFSGEVDLAGREFHQSEQTTGSYRYISTTMTFHYLAALLPAARFC